MDDQLIGKLSKDFAGRAFGLHSLFNDVALER